MNRWKKEVFCLLALLLIPAAAFGAGWPKIEGALQAWEGPKETLLRSSHADPLMSPLVQDLLETLLNEGYAVQTAAMEATAEAGLVLDLRTAAGAEMVALRRARDGAIIAFERHSGPGEPVAASVPAGPAPVDTEDRTPSAALPAASPPPRTSTAPENAPLYGPLELEGRPRGLAVVKDQGLQELELALLYDDKLISCRIENLGLKPLAEFAPAIAGTRALHLDAADLNGDGGREVAAVWTEDLRGIYQGTDSRLHGWLLSASLRPLTIDQRAYLRLHDRQAVMQRRGTYQPFQGPVRPFMEVGGEWSVAKKPLLWGGNIFAALPLDEQTALGRDDKGRLQLVERVQGRPLPGSLLLQDLGEFFGPQIAVQLENPEYRSGFGKDDLIRERYHPLPARQAAAADGAVYTIRRGRSSGLPLLGKPAGQDRVVRVVRQGNQLLLEEPFAGVDAYILDFALLDRPGLGPGAVLLLNDRPDGSGRAHLLIQTGR